MPLLSRIEVVARRTGLCAVTAAALMMPAVTPGRAETEEEVLQMMADATVIDGLCRTTNTLYGAVFRYGEAHGIDRGAILLFGRRRPAFEAAMALRQATSAPDEICGSLQIRYRDAFPDWFRTR